MANVTKIKLPNGNEYTIKDSGALPLTGGTVTGPVIFGDSITVDEATLGDLVVNGNASFTNNIQANTINGVAVGITPKFTDTVTTVTTTGSGNAVTAITASNGALTVTKDTTFLTSHQDISGKADKATTLAGYGITDAKIVSGVITLGSNTITPVTSVGISNGGGLSVSGSPITSSGTITISHADTSSQASSSNSGRTYIQSITLDTYGHVTGLSTATETVTNTDTKLTTEALTSGTTYYPILADGANVGKVRQVDSTLGGLKYTSTAGTTSVMGEAILELGNAITIGTANNESGSLRLYGTSSYYQDLIPSPSITANKNVFLPPKGGVLALKGESFESIYVEDAAMTIYASDTPNITFQAGTGITMNADDLNGYISIACSISNTDEKLKIAEVTSATQYYPIVGTGTTATTRQYDTTGFTYTGTSGTANASNGAAVLTLGNSTASSTGGWKKGKVSLYGSTIYATTLDPGAPTAARTLTLPDATGTVALTSNIPSNQNIVDLIYPVGSIYMSINSTDPGTLFGGSWTRLKDTFLLAAGDTYAADDGTHTTATGGASSVTLTAAQSGLKSHSHDITYSSNDMYFLTVAKSPDNAVTRSNIKAGTSTEHKNVLHSDNAITRLSSTASSSGDATSAHENMPPYLTVYMWKRVS